MRRAADIISGIFAGVVGMLAAIAWADGNSLVALLIGIIAMLMLAVYALTTKEARPPVRYTRVTVGGKTALEVPAGDEVSA